MKREKKGCFDVEGGICIRGVSSEVRRLESVIHKHSAPVPFLPPAIDYHFKPDLEFCAFCPFHSTMVITPVSLRLVYGW